MLPPGPGEFKGELTLLYISNASLIGEKKRYTGESFSSAEITSLLEPETEYLSQLRNVLNALKIVSKVAAVGIHPGPCNWPFFEDVPGADRDWRQPDRLLSIAEGARALGRVQEGPVLGKGAISLGLPRLALWALVWDTLVTPA